MNCSYCVEYVLSERRIEPSGEDGKKCKSNRRLCDAKKIWVNPNQELCEKFTASKSFYCNRRHCWMGVDSCRNSKLKKLSRHCKNCSQYAEVLDTIRFRSRSKAAPQETPSATATKPLIRRRGSEK